MITASIAGASGTRAANCPAPGRASDIEVTAVAAGGRAGESVLAVHPNLADASPVLGTADPESWGCGRFPRAPAWGVRVDRRVLPSTAKVVDLGADFRLADAHDWVTYYGGTHAGQWTYGLPELPGHRTAIAASTRVANPGCYATAVTLALAPVLAAGLADPDDVVVVAASGTSGAGRKASDALLASQVMGSMSAYKVGGVHQHTPEMEQALSASAGAEVTVSFTPLLAPMPRGIVATCTAVARAGATAGAVRDALMAAYAHERFVTVLPPGHWPQTSSVAGSNSVQVQAAVDAHSGRIIVVSAIDNLGKGAAGQALQNANIMLGLDEASGLSRNGVAP
jgi:N-acetyl-gamma-glutamyl-phosphate reductase